MRCRVDGSPVHAFNERDWATHPAWVDRVDGIAVHPPAINVAD
jgi:hypothetical protein